MPRQRPASVIEEIEIAGERVKAPRITTIDQRSL